MKRAPRLILINGPAGIGKTTIAQKYITDNPLSLHASTDDIIASLGQWVAQEDKARKLAFSLLEVMVAKHLAAGHDVVVPHLLTNTEDAVALERISKDQSASFFECILIADKEEAVERLLERGRWGEVGAPPLTAQDRPIIEKLYEEMEIAARDRPRAIVIHSAWNDVEGTYAQLLSALN